jgi:ribosome-binding protein aMBF1 (putative translation factor)
MRNWLLAVKCLISGHKVVKGDKCPVTGAQLLTCTKCGKDNMPKHGSGMSFN